jgi:hypothetical protein
MVSFMWAMVMLLVASPIEARGEADCPCDEPPVYICCGSMTCDVWSNQATYVMGGSCAYKKNYYCCVNGGPFLRPLESTEEPLEQFDVTFVDKRGRPVDWLTNGIKVWMEVNGERVPGKVGHGRFVDGYLEMKDGTRYLVLAGDLHLVYD